MKRLFRVCKTVCFEAMESSCAQIEVFSSRDSRLLHCDPVRNKASVLLGLTHTVKLSHTPYTDSYRDTSLPTAKDTHVRSLIYTKKTCRLTLTRHIAHAYCIVNLLFHYILHLALKAR